MYDVIITRWFARTNERQIFTLYLSTRRLIQFLDARIVRTLFFVCIIVADQTSLVKPPTKLVEPNHVLVECL